MLKPHFCVFMGTSFQWCKMRGTLFLWAFGRDRTSLAEDAKCKHVKSGFCCIQSMFDFIQNYRVIPKIFQEVN